MSLRPIILISFGPLVAILCILMGLLGKGNQAGEIASGFYSWGVGLKKK